MASGVLELYLHRITMDLEWVLVQRPTKVKIPCLFLMGPVKKSYGTMMMVAYPDFSGKTPGAAAGLKPARTPVPRLWVYPGRNLGQGCAARKYGENHDCGDKRRAYQCTPRRLRVAGM